MGNGQQKLAHALAYNDENGNFKPLPFNFTRSTSATRVNKDGLIETVGSNDPRIDFLNDANGALLLEPTKSNLIQYSETFDNAYWTKLGTAFTITSNNAISPSGELNASTINVTNNDNILYKSIPLSSSQSNWNFSIYAKGTGTFDMNIRLNSATLTTETKTLTNEWQRFDVSATRTPTITSVESYIELNTSSTYQIWGAQVEESYPTSYIPTQGATATRVAETCNQTPPSGIIGQTEGTLFVEYSALSNDLTYRSIGLNSGGATNRLLITFNNVSNNINFLVQVGGVTQVSINYSGATITSNLKVAFAYKENDFVAYVNGTQAGTDTSGSTYSSGTLTTFSFDNSVGADKLVAKLNQVLLFPTRLSNAELQALTTI
jgi:hypothetical protein